MAVTIKLKNASGSDPSASDLVVGEVALRTDSGKLFTKKDDGSVAQIGGGAGAIDDGAITNAKVASDAAIAGSKISPDFGSQNIVTTGTLSSGVLSLINQSGLRLNESSSNGSNYIELKAPSTLSGNFSFTFPNTNPSVLGSGGGLLRASTSGQLSWDTSNFLESGESINITSGTTFINFGQNNKIKFDSDNSNTYEITFVAPNTLTKDSDFTLPEDGSDGQFLKTDGSGVLSFGQIVTASITDDAVTYAKIQNVSATNRILGRDSSGAGVIEEITPANLRTMINVEDGATADQTASEIVALVAGQDIAPSEIDMGDSGNTSGNTNAILLGASDDLRIFHDGSNSYIRDFNGTGNIKITANQLDILNNGNNEFMAKFIQNGSVELYEDNVKRFETTSGGATVTGSITASSTGNASLILDAGTGSASGDQISFVDLKIDGTVKGNIAINEGASGTPLELNSASGTGSVQLFNSGNKKFETTSSGATVTGTLVADGFTGSLTGNVTGNASGSSGSCTGNAATATTLANARTIAGVSFDGSANISLNNNAITNGAGYITSADGGNAATLDGIDSSSFLRSDANDTSSGVLTLSRASSDGRNLKIYNTTNGSSATIEFSDHSTQSQKGFLEYFHADGSSNSAGNSFHFDSTTSSTAVIIDQTAGNSGFYVGTNEVWHAGNDGSGSGLDADTLDGLDSSQFLRSDTSDNLVGNLTISAELNFLGGSDASRYIDSQVGNSGGSHALNLRAVTGGDSGHENMAQFFGGGAVKLFHNGTSKFETSSSGISVAGSIVVSGTVDGRDVASDGSKLDGIASGATNVTNNNQLTNGAGYVTSSGNTIIGTDSDINTSGATVIDQLNMTDGVIQSHSTRTMTLANLGYTGATNANNVTNNNQLSNGAGYITSGSDRACRAWVNFRGNSSVTRNDHANVSSVSDNGVGHYTVSFSSSMPNSSYCVTVGFMDDAGNSNVAKIVDNSLGTGSFQIRTGSFQDGSGNTDRDFDGVFCAVFAG